MVHNHDAEYIEGYLDGRDPDTPYPGDNRTHCYKHSWFIGRLEIMKMPVLPARELRAMARIAALKDELL
tara:strand:+ start:996 stop:1202 length:207 start_codon:yes stop_codon:yes gene_type:complete